MRLPSIISAETHSARNSDSSKCVRVSTLAAAVAALWCSPLYAQSIPPSSSGAVAERADRAPQSRMLEEVTVTARRREESAQSVPVSITAFDAGTLEDLQIDDLNDLQTAVPSLSVSPASGRPNSPVYSLRGVRPTEALYGQDPTVAIYFADVVLSPARGSNLGLYDLSSVQVLKGPQGTLFGRNTTGGAILLTPQRPDHEFGGSLMVGVGDDGLYESEFAVNVPVSNEFAMRVSGRTVDSDGYQTNVAPGPLYGDELGGEQTRSARVQLLWNVADTVENLTILTWDEMKSTGPAAVLEAVNPASNLRLYNGGAPFNLPSIFDAAARAQSRDVHKIESDLRPTSEVEVWGLINTTTVDLPNEKSLKSIVAYRDLEAVETVDMDATAIPGILSPFNPSSLEHASYELQLQGSSLDERLDWVTGLYWYYEQGNEDAVSNVLAGVNPSNPFVQDIHMRNNSYSLFAQGSYHLSSRLSITAGARWTYDDKEMELASKFPTVCGMRNVSGSPLPIDQCSATLSDSFSQPTGTISVEYTPIDSMLIYAATRLGYRAGGFNGRAVQPIEYEPFDPETVTDLELGMKTDWFAGDWEMRSNVAVYNQWYDDIQRTVTVPNPAGAPGSSIVNAAQATVFGIELEQMIAVTENLVFRLNYTYTDPEYDEWQDPVTGEDLSSTPFPFTPRHAASLLTTYSVPLGDAGMLAFTAAASYKGEVWIDGLVTSEAIEATPGNLREDILKQEAYWLYDVSARWSEIMGTNLEMTAYVKNLTDEEYAVGGVKLYSTFGLSTKVYGEPRTFGLQLRYSF